MRGSIPLYWNQEGITTLKPDITLQHYDPLYTATRLHFEVALLHTQLVFPTCLPSRNFCVTALCKEACSALQAV